MERLEFGSIATLQHLESRPEVFVIDANLPEVVIQEFSEFCRNVVEGGSKVVAVNIGQPRSLPRSLTLLSSLLVCQVNVEDARSVDHFERLLEILLSDAPREGNLLQEASAVEKWCRGFTAPIVLFLQERLCKDAALEGGYWKVGKAPLGKWNVVCPFSGRGYRGSLCLSCSIEFLELAMLSLFSMPEEMLAQCDVSARWDAFAELANLLLAKVRAHFRNELAANLHLGQLRKIVEHAWHVPHIYEGHVYVVPVSLGLVMSARGSEFNMPGMAAEPAELHPQEAEFVLEFCIKMDENDPGVSSGSFDTAVLESGDVVFLLAP